MRKHIILSFIIVFCFIFAVPVMAAPTVELDGQQLIFTDIQPIIEDGRTLVPLRSIFEAMGATVTWRQDNQTATAVKGNITVILPVGSTEPTINGQVKKLDVSAKIVNGRILAPMRFVCEAFGASVNWNSNLYRAEITSNNQSSSIKISTESSNDYNNLVALDKKFNNLYKEHKRYLDYYMGRGVLRTELINLISEINVMRQEINNWNSSKKNMIIKNDWIACLDSMDNICRDILNGHVLDDDTFVNDIRTLNKNVDKLISDRNELFQLK